MSSIAASLLARETDRARDEGWIRLCSYCCRRCHFIFVYVQWTIKTKLHINCIHISFAEHRKDRFGTSGVYDWYNW